MTVADLQILIDKLQSKISQLELTNKGALKATEFRLEAILQANLCLLYTSPSPRDNR